MTKKFASVVLSVGLGFLCFTSLSYGELIGFWKFDEGSGTTVADSSGKGNNATIFNATGGLSVFGNHSVWVTDIERGSVISFNGFGKGAYVLTKDGIIPKMSFTQNFTWAFWAKQVAGNADNDIIFGNRMSINATDYSPRAFVKFTPTKFEFHANAVGTDNMEYDDIPNGVWLHHVVVKNGKQFTYYRNGVEGGKQTQTLEIPVAMPLFFGGDNEGSDGENWKGFMDNARIYDEALTAAAVMDLYKSEKSSKTANSESYK